MSTLPIASDDFAEFKCPFCARRVQVTISSCEVIHAMPTCELFRELEPNTYMYEVALAHAASEVEVN